MKDTAAAGSSATGSDLPTKCALGGAGVLIFLCPRHIAALLFVLGLAGIYWYMTKSSQKTEQEHLDGVSKQLFRDHGRGADIAAPERRLDGEAKAVPKIQTAVAP